MAATYCFGTDLFVSADSTAKAREELLELLADIVARRDTDAFFVSDLIYEDADDLGDGYRYRDYAGQGEA